MENKICNENLQQKLALFASNTQDIKSSFRWHDEMSKRLAALLYALNGRIIDCGAIEEAHKLIKNNTGAFSVFRGNMALCVAALMSMNDNPENVFSNTLAVYEMLKKTKLYASDFLAVAAYQIAAHGNPEQYGLIVERTRAFYDGMKSKHWFLTGQDDYIFAAMLGLSDIEVSDGTEHMEQIFSRLKPEFWGSNSLQTLTQVLILGGNTAEAPDRVLVLRDALKNHNIKLDKTYTLPVLGTLALIPIDAETIVNDIDHAQLFLRSQKGFGSFSVDKQQLLIFSASIVASVYAENLKDNVLTAALATSITNIIIAQEAAMIAAICASSAAAAAASN